MRARWRLGILVVELLLLTAGTWLAVGQVVPAKVWYASGLLSVVVNPLLLERFYPRPYDVIGNSILGTLLAVWSPREVAEPGWIALLAFLGISAIFAAVALIFGANRDDPPGFARSARTLSTYATSTVIYSGVFWLSLLEEFSIRSESFWTLGVTWALIVLIGSVNWEQVWSSVAGTSGPGHAQALLGPATLLITAADLPDPGTPVRLEARGMSSAGTVVTRIRRLRDAWGQVHVTEAVDAARLLRASPLRIVEEAHEGHRIVGSVGPGSTERRLSFSPATPLEVGTVVAVRMNGAPVMYQLESARIDEMKVRGGSHLVVSAVGNQIGRFNSATKRLDVHRWIPEAGAPVLGSVPELDSTAAATPSNALRLGRVIGTNVPVFLDLDLACEGHIVILGMTKMGKTSLAMRLANALEATRGVVILDQTGEYRAHRSVPAHILGQWNPGVSVHEPAQGAVGPDFARAFVQATAEAAAAEYEVGSPTPRSIMFEEAHQFIPEPAGLSFSTPGRDSAYQLGVDIMQLRKYGISMTLISQRTAVVAKSALSQCETMIAFRSVDQTGLDYLEQIAGGGVRNLLPTLRQGEALVLGTAISSDRPVAIAVDL
jgi:hypothetical protein